MLALYHARLDETMCKVTRAALSCLDSWPCAVGQDRQDGQNHGSDGQDGGEDELAHIASPVKWAGRRLPLGAI
jgi:hypothetical protein